MNIAVNTAITGKRGAPRIAVTPPTVNVYMLAGQSNAFGNADISLVSSTYVPAIPRSYIYYKPGLSTMSTDSAFSADNGYWSPLQLNVNNQLVDYCGVKYGPELEFCYQMQNYLNKPIYIVKFAIGDTALQEESTSGTIGLGGLLDWAKISTGELYGRLVNYYAIRAARDLVTMGFTPVFKSMFWMQAERDAFFATFGNNYQGNLQNLASNIRTDITAAGYNASSMQFVIGRLSDEVAASRSAGGPTIRTAQVTVGGQTNNAWFDTDAFTMQADQVHYSEPIQPGNAWYLLARDY